MGSKTNVNLEEHSKAKVQLWDTYLRIYLNILSRVSFLNQLIIYDFFCGEGMYANDQPGSPIVTLNAIKDHYNNNSNTCPNINLVFNDKGKSQIEKDKLRIDRVKEFGEKIFKPTNVNVDYCQEDAPAIFKKAIDELNKMTKNDRALLFIDPWGYKFIKPDVLKQLLSNGKTEVILFLPTSHMYRFTAKAINEKEFPGGKPLEEFVKELFGQESPDMTSALKYIASLRKQFQTYLNINYSDTFTIDRGQGQFFSLFFFTNNSKGYQKMLESKWKLDEEQGRGFKLNTNPNQTSMFDVVEASSYDSDLESYIENNGGATNLELLEFGLKLGFLPKHTGQVLNTINKTKKVTVQSLDSKAADGYYLNDQKRKVKISIN